MCFPEYAGAQLDHAVLGNSLSVEKLKISEFEIENIKIEQDTELGSTILYFSDSVFQMANVISGIINGHSKSYRSKDSEISISGDIILKALPEKFTNPTSFWLSVKKHTGESHAQGVLKANETSKIKGKPMLEIQFSATSKHPGEISAKGMIISRRIPLIKTMPGIEKLAYSLQVIDRELVINLSPVPKESFDALPFFSNLKIRVNPFTPLTWAAMESQKINFEINFDELNLDEIGYIQRLDLAFEANSIETINQFRPQNNDLSYLLKKLLNLDDSLDMPRISIRSRDGFLYSPFISYETLSAEFSPSKSLLVETEGFRYNSEEFGKVSLSILNEGFESSKIEIFTQSDNSRIHLSSPIQFGHRTNQNHESFILSNVSSSLTLENSELLNIIPSTLPINKVSGNLNSKGKIAFNLENNKPSVTIMELDISLLFESIYMEALGLSFLNVRSEGKLDMLNKNHFRINGSTHMSEASISDVVLKDSEIEIYHNEKGPFMTLRKSHLFDGRIDSSPIFLGNLPDKLAFHLNINELNSGKVANLVKSFEGNLKAKIDGQLAAIIEDNQIKFQYGAFRLNNSVTPRLEWITDGLLTGGMLPRGFAYRKMKKTEDAISNLSLNKLNILISSMNIEESLIQVNIHGNPVDRKIKNPVILDFNFAGNWQKLADYFLPGSEISVNQE